MRIKISPLLYGIFAIFLICLLLFVIIFIPKFSQNSTASENTAVPYPIPESPPLIQNILTSIETTPIPETATTPLPQIIWSDPPECSNEPLDSSAWKQILLDMPESQKVSLISRINQLSSYSLNLDATKLNTLLSLPSTAPRTYRGQRELAVLLLNIASGRLNRTTEVLIPELSDIRIIDDLVTLLVNVANGESSSDLPIQANILLEAGSGISQSVCARLLILQAGNQLKEAIWTDDDIFQLRDVESFEIPGIALNFGSLSPDGQHVIFMSSSHNGDKGGPLFQFDIQTGEWTNMIFLVNSFSDEKLLDDQWWTIIGWHPDGNKLLVGPDDLGSVYWIDTLNSSLQMFPIASNGNGGNKIIDLDPDGKRFVYIGVDSGDDVQKINLYNLETNQTTTLITQSFNQGILYYPRFSPDNGTLSYVVQMGHPLTGMTYSINLLDLKTKEVRIIVDGNLGLTLPVWSPDGKFIAFSKKEPDQPDLVVLGQRVDPQQGNIWIASVMDGWLQQVTFIEGNARSPVWAGDSKTLAFVTHDGQIGMVNIEHPGLLWQADTTSTVWTSSTSTFFIP
jgi:Tol biopolymer transport system component